MEVIAAVKLIATVIVGAVETVGVIATGASFGAAGSIIAGTAILSAPFAIKGLMPDISLPQSDTDTTRQQTVRGTIEVQKVVYGEALVSGPIFFVGVAAVSYTHLTLPTTR